MAKSHTIGEALRTRILLVNANDLGQFKDGALLESWDLPANLSDHAHLHEAALHLKSSNIPVAFPTETVYGLGADATRSDAVKGIYKAKGRPSDNPLIIHICDLAMLRNLLIPSTQVRDYVESTDLIPEIYLPLIKRFWPGPLTILLPIPSPTRLAPEVTAGLQTFGVRMPDSPLALSLIRLAGVPLAAPSANASTKPSPTTAEHVLHDLNGRIEIILDGGTCQVGVESTVVDGICDPPVVLRPGGISIDQIRECKGWHGVAKGYKDQSEVGLSAPRAPGMKYKHYSPKAKVMLYEATSHLYAEVGQGPRSKIPQGFWSMVTTIDLKMSSLDTEGREKTTKIGIVCTTHWDHWAGFMPAGKGRGIIEVGRRKIEMRPIDTEKSLEIRQGELWEGCSLISKDGDRCLATVVAIALGKDTKAIAHGLFSALRELDQRGVEIIFVEGIDDEGDLAAAVMNRLRKAATVIER